MAKLSFADKLAKKSFESPKFQQSWAVHMQSFGPILEPAFRENYQARVHLTAALNFISTRQFGPGLDKLKLMKKYCETDADKTAILFFMGVCFEMMGDTENMLAFYCAANELGHRFYLPYIKAGKLLLQQHDYEMAYESYQAAISCFNATGLSDREKLILGSAYTNLASSLTMMHRYEESGAALRTSRDLYPDAPGRAAAEAVLYALRGNTDELTRSLETLKTVEPGVYEAIRKTTDAILAGTDPRFFEVPIEETSITAFWEWFSGYSPELLSLIGQEKYGAALRPVADHLLAAFPFLEEAPYIALGKNEQGYVLELRDVYAVAVAHAYEVLLAARPAEMQDKWQFVVKH